MQELSYQELIDIDGGKLSTVLTGMGIAAFGFALMASATATAPVLAAGFTLYEAGKVIAIVGATEK